MMTVTQSTTRFRTYADDIARIIGVTPGFYKANGKLDIIGIHLNSYAI